MCLLYGVNLSAQDIWCPDAMSQDSYREKLNRIFPSVVFWSIFLKWMDKILKIFEGAKGEWLGEREDEREGGEGGGEGIGGRKGEVKVEDWVQ